MAALPLPLQARCQEPASSLSLSLLPENSSAAGLGLGRRWLSLEGVGESRLEFSAAPTLFCFLPVGEEEEEEEVEQEEAFLRQESFNEFVWPGERERRELLFGCDGLVGGMKCWRAAF